MTQTKISLHLAFCVAVTVLLLGCAPAAQVPSFDGNRAFGFLKKQCDIGPRYSGSPGHDEAARLILSQLEAQANGARTQDFIAKVGGRSLAMSNIIGWFNPDAKKWVLLAAHWDTRPRADCEVNAKKCQMPIPGANDGASGVAVLLELARAFHKSKPDVGVLMVFLDGEDYGPGESGMYLGAKYFADNLKDSLTVNRKQVKIAYGILLDMVGDRNLGIYQERQSVRRVPEVVEKVWSTAKRLGYESAFRPQAKYRINDDHIPFLDAGIKCIDVIDFDYGAWHTLDDTPDKCSPESLRIVGDVIAHVVYEEEP